MTALCEPEHRCGRCNNFRDATDLANLDGVPLCHGAFDRSPTCYQRTTLEGSVHPEHLVEAFRKARGK